VRERDIHGGETRTAGHLLAFRNWLLEQMRRDASRQFFNATAGGILHGDGIQQITLDELPGALERGRTRPALDQHHAPAQDQTIAGALHDLLAATPSQAAEDALTAWVAFADGLTRENLLEAAAYASHQRAQTAAPLDRVAPVTPTVVIDRDVLRQLAATTRLVPMPLAPERLLPAAQGARVFRFRTAAARLAGAAWRTWCSGVHEDGVPLNRGFDVDDVRPGSYVLHRDEIHVRGTAGSDARVNGRRYTVLVPGFVAYLEQLALEDVLRLDL
jgi:hypothetical protein